MASADKNKKKAFFVFALLFFVFGGGASLFFISSGIESMKGDDASNKGFRYGFSFRKAAFPVFSYLGFTEGEDELADKDKITVVSPEEFDELQKSALAASNSKSSAKSRLASNSKKRSSFARKRIPKMSARRKGLGLGGGARTKSSGGVSKFSKRSLKKDVKITETGYSAGKKMGTNKIAFNSIRKTENLLAQTHGTNSALAARSKWDQSFVGGGLGGAKGKLSYGGKAAKLDKIESSVMNLKENRDGSLDIPEVGAPKDADSGAGADSALKKAAKAANPLGGLLNTMMRPVGKSFSGGMGSNKPEAKGFQTPDHVRSYIDIVREKGEEATVTRVFCGSDSYCADNGVMGGEYYKVAYGGVGDLEPAFETMGNSEDGMISLRPEEYNQD